MEAKFIPPAIGYDPKRVFFEELGKVLPELTVARLTSEAAWVRFIGISSGPWSGDAAVSIGEEDYRSLAAAWAVREKSCIARDEAKKAYDEATTVIASILERESKRAGTKCMMPDFANACLREHDCKNAHDHDDADADDEKRDLLERLERSGAPKEILELVRLAQKAGGDVRVVPIGGGPSIDLPAVGGQRKADKGQPN